MPWFYYVSKFLVRMLFSLLTRREVKGRENMPGEGPALIVANHMNLTDVPLLVISSRRTVIFMAKKELFYFKPVGYFVGRLGSFPIHRGKLDRKALRQALQLLADGSALVMFPEGRRSKNAKLQPGFPGAALIALRSGAPIVPIGITGTEKIKGITWLLRRPRVTVNIGRPFKPPPVDSKLTKAELVQLTDTIMQRIAELLPPEYQGNRATEKVKME